MFQAVDLGEQIGISARGVKSSGSHLPSALTPFEPKHVWGEPATWTRSPFLDVVSTGSCNHSWLLSYRLLCLLFRFCPSQRALQETQLQVTRPILLLNVCTHSSISRTRSGKGLRSLAGCAYSKEFKYGDLGTGGRAVLCSPLMTGPPTSVVGCVACCLGG